MFSMILENGWGNNFVQDSSMGVLASMEKITDGDTKFWRQCQQLMVSNLYRYQFEFHKY